VIALARPLIETRLAVFTLISRFFLGIPASSSHYMRAISPSVISLCLLATTPETGRSTSARAWLLIALGVLFGIASALAGLAALGLR